MIPKKFLVFVEPTLMEKQLKFSLEKNFYLEAVNNGPNGFPLGNQARITYEIIISNTPLLG